MELQWCADAGAPSLWWFSNHSVEQRTVADDDGYQGWGEVLRTLCGSALSYLQLPTGKHSLCLDLTVFGLPVRVRMQSDAVKTAGILCIIGIGIGIGITSWLVCKLHGPAGRSHGRTFRWGRDGHSTQDFGSRRSRSLVSKSKSLAIGILPSELFSLGSARRRRQALESHDVEAETRDGSVETSVLIDVLERDVTVLPGSSQEAEQWLSDETFIDRRVHGPIAKHGRQSQTVRSTPFGISDVLGWGRHCQTSASGRDLAASLSDVVCSSTRLCPAAAEKGQAMQWHSALAALSNAPSMQSSTRDSGFLEWAPGDMQQSTEDERFAPVLPHTIAEAGSSCDSADAAVDSICTSLPQTRQRLASADQDCCAWIGADSQQRTSSEARSPLCRATVRSVEAWVTQQQQQQRWPSSFITPADCAHVPEYEVHNKGYTVSRKSSVAGSASVRVASVAAEGDDLLLLADGVCSMKPAQAVGQDVRVCPDSLLCETGEHVDHDIACNRNRKEYAAAAAPVAVTPAPSSQAMFGPLTAFSDLAGADCETAADLSGSDRAPSKAGRLLQDECAIGSLASVADRPWSPASDLTFESWTDDLPSCSAGSSAVASPMHSAASNVRCCCCSRASGSVVNSPLCQSTGRAFACAVACDNRPASPASSSLSFADVARSTSSLDGPDTVERLSAIETELGILKAEMSEIEQCLRGLIVRDSFDSIYSPERFRKLTRVVLESDHMSGLTSAEIGKAFDILRKYRPGRAANRDDFSRGSSWPDESGPQERRNSFSDSPRRSRESALRELFCEADASSDDELAGRRCVAAGRSGYPTERTGGVALRKAGIKTSSSLTNLAALTSSRGGVSASPNVNGSTNLQSDPQGGSIRASATGSANEREEPGCRRRAAVFQGLKLVDISAACRSTSSDRSDESVNLAKGIASIADEMGLSQMCTVEGSIDCCALRAVLIGTLLAQLPLTPRLRQASSIFKELSSPHMCADSMFGQRLPGEPPQSDSCRTSSDESAVIMSLLAEADQEVKVLEECLARHAGSASRQHDVEMLSDLLLGVFNDRDRDEVLLNALEVLMALRAYRLNTTDVRQLHRLDGNKRADSFAGVSSVPESPDRFWLEILRRRNEQGQRRRLEAVDLCTLAESLGCVFLLLRPSRYGQVDFSTYLPPRQKSEKGAPVDSHTVTSSLPIVTLVTDDGERYSVALS